MTNQGAPKIPGYARVKTTSGDRLIKVSRETERRVVGMRVRLDGSTWERVRKGEVHQELVIVSPNDVVERLVMNTFYGELEKAP